MPARIAIVGSGPSGCYMAQALRKALPDAEISIIDRLPVPYGLVRYGVAPDHQGTKGVTRQFQRLFERQDVGFLGNLEIGRDVTLDALRGAMDAVVLATGLYGDRAVDADGAELKTVFGAGAVTRYWNGHPDNADTAPNFGRSVAIVGNGNVALDIARLLAKTESDFAGSDMDPSLTVNGVGEIHVIGRGSLSKAKFDVAMFRELCAIDNLSCALAPGDEIGDDDNEVAAAARDLLGAGSSADEGIRLLFHSEWDVAKIEGEDGQVSGMQLSRANGGRKTIACDSVVTAIGFQSDSHLSSTNFPGSNASGTLDHGLFATGWFRRGPQGTIPENRADAQEIATRVVDWLAENTDATKPGRAALSGADDLSLTDYNDWRAVDQHELSSAPPDRCRKKVRTTSEMLKIMKNARPEV